MLKFKLVEDIVMSEDKVLIGNRELKNAHIDPLYNLARSAGGSTYLEMAVADLAIVAIFLAAGLQYQETAQPIELNKKIRGVLIGTFVGLVNIQDNTFCYLPIASDSKEKGTLKLTNPQRKKLFELVNKVAQISTMNLNLKRDGVNLIITILNENGERVMFQDKFSNFIFTKLEDDVWSVGGIQVNTEGKDNIIKTANKLFGFTTPQFKTIEIERCGYKSKDKPMNELFATVREANKKLNSALAQNKTDNVPELFWNAFYTKLELINARGLDIDDIFNAHANYVEECIESNKQKI